MSLGVGLALAAVVVGLLGLVWMVAREVAEERRRRQRMEAYRRALVRYAVVQVVDFYRRAGQGAPSRTLSQQEKHGKQ